MDTKQKRKKPTNKERDSAINHILQRLASVEQIVDANQSVLQMYVQYKEDTDKFNKWMTDTIEEHVKASKEKDDKKDVSETS